MSSPPPVTAPAGTASPNASPDASPVTRSLAPAAQRLVFYDAAKLVAAFGVVFFHAHVRFADVWYAGMFLFVFFVGFAQGRTRTLAELVRARARRLLLPWLFWVAAYLPLLLVSPARWLASREEPGLWLAIGPVIHLWFLPFAFVAGIACAALKPERTPPFARRLALLVAGIALGLWVYHLASAAPPPIPQWLVSLPMTFAGFVIAQGGSPGGAQAQRFALFAAVMLTSIAAMLLGQVDGALQMLVIAPVCLLAITLRGPAVPVLARAGDMAFGVYLIHPAVALVVRRVPAIADQPMLLAIVVAAGSLAATAVLRTTRFGRFVT